MSTGAAPEMPILSRANDIKRTSSEIHARVGLRARAGVGGVMHGLYPPLHMGSGSEPGLGVGVGLRVWAMQQPGGARLRALLCSALLQALCHRCLELLVGCLFNPGLGLRRPEPLFILGGMVKVRLYPRLRLDGP